MANIYEEDITGLPPSIDYPILDLKPTSRASQFSILNQAAPTQSTPVGGTVQGTEGPIPTLPGQQSGMSRFLKTGLIPVLQQLATGFIKNPQVQQDTLNRIAQQQEQQRKQRAGQEAQSVTGILSAALASGNPTKFAEAVKQISGLKNLEPETGQAVQNMMLSMSAKMGEAAREKQEEAALGEILKNLPQAEAKPIGDFIAAGGKSADALKLYSSGLLKPQKSILEQIQEIQRVTSGAPGGGPTGVAPMWNYSISSKGEVSVQTQQQPSEVQQASIRLAQILPPNHPRFGEMVGKLMLAQSYKGEHLQYYAIQDVLAEARLLRSGDALAAAQGAPGAAAPAPSGSRPQPSAAPAQPATREQHQQQFEKAERQAVVQSIAPGDTAFQGDLMSRATQAEAHRQGLLTQAREQAQRAYGQMPVGLQQDMTALSENIAVLDYVRKEFSDKELEKYVGIARLPYNRLSTFWTDMFGGGEKAKQEARRFSQFFFWNQKLKSGAFATGGKQLTPFEASVVFGFTPHGEEMGGAIEYKAKLEGLIRFTRAAAKAREEVWKTAPKDLSPEKLANQLQSILEKQGWKPGVGPKMTYDSKTGGFNYSIPGVAE